MPFSGSGRVLFPVGPVRVHLWFHTAMRELFQALSSHINSLSLWFPLFLNEDINTTSLIRLWRESNERMHVATCSICLADSKCSISM